LNAFIVSQVQVLIGFFHIDSINASDKTLKFFLNFIYYILCTALDWHAKHHCVNYTMFHPRGLDGLSHKQYKVG